MSLQIPNWYVEQWRAEAFHVFQSKGFTLRGTVTPPIRIDGEKLHFRKVARAEAEEDVQPGDKAKRQNLTRTKITLTTKKSRAFFEVDEDDFDLTQLNLPQINGEAGAMALGRVYDRLILNTMVDGAGETEGDYSEPVTPEMLLKARQKLAANSVPASDGQIFAAIDSVSWAVCLTYKEFVSSDYVGPNLPYVNGALAKTWNGIHVFQADDEILRITSTTQADCVMWHRSAFGFGTLYELKGSVQWENDPGQWTHNLRQRYGATVLQAEGIVHMKSDYDPAHITFS